MLTLTNRTAALIALSLAITAAYQGAKTMVEDVAYTRVQTELGFWGRENYQPTPQRVMQTGQTIGGLVKQSPGHPEYLSLQAYYTSWQAYWSDDPGQREVLNRKALQLASDALPARPAHRQNWSKVVEYASRTSIGEPVMQKAHTKVELLSPGKS